MKKIDKNEVAKLLVKISEIDRNRIPKDKSGNLDVKRFNEMKDIKKMIKELKALGVKHSSQLFDLGFIPAGMVLKF